MAGLPGNGPFGLVFLDLPDGALYQGVGFFQQFFGCFLGVVYYLFLFLFQLVQFLAVVERRLLVLFLELVDLLPLLFPVALVAHDVLQVFVAVDVVLSYDLRGFPYDVLRKSYLACYLDGKRAARAAYGELEQGFHLVAVVEHGPVLDAGAGVGKMFEVLVVGGDDAEGPFLVEFSQDGFGYGPSDLRFGPAAELVDEDERAVVGMAEHLFHVGQVGGVGAQFVFDGLLVAYVDKDGAEEPRFAFGR